ncbi:MAG: hydantoinase/oxoprolinase family protein [Gammaproteobacteria bacterium]
MLINIDNGGTLTDFCAYDGDRLLLTKTLTTPHDLSSCFFDGLNQLAELAYGEGDVVRLLQETDYVRYSTTQGTNALVQRSGPRVGLIVREHEHAQALRVSKTAGALFDSVVGERVRTLPGGLDDEARDAAVTQAVNELGALGANRVVVSLDCAEPAAAEQQLQRILLRRFPSHLLGALPVTCAAQGEHDPDFARRTWTALLNAFLHPAMERFLFSAERRLKQHRTRNRLLIFRNDGGAARVAKTIALKTYSSGPRGGLTGARELALSYGFERLLSIDVGGTTTDIAAVVGGEFDEAVHGAAEGIDVSIPLGRIHSEGVGGSSIIAANGDRIDVGPKSVGAAPGPACFGRGGDALTMTDIALLNGMIDASTFFGGDLKLDADRAKEALQRHIAEPLGLDSGAACAAAENAWVEAITTGIRRSNSVSEETVLLGIGGGGPMLLTSIAEALSLRRAMIPGMAPVFSAYGIGFSALSQHYQLHVENASAETYANTCGTLMARARRDMFAEGLALESCELNWQLLDEAGDTELARWQGMDAAPEHMPAAAILRFEVSKPIDQLLLPPERATDTSPAETPRTRRLMGAGGTEDVPLYLLSELKAGAERLADGPCIVEDRYFTARIDDGWTFRLTHNRDLLLERSS